MLPVLVAIATYNRLEFTQRCVASLLETTTPEEIQIGFFDNGSTDGTAEWLDQLAASQDKRIPYVFHANTNVGTARGINHIWRLRKPDQYAIKLDNDVVFNNTGWISRMVKVMEMVPVLGQIGLKRIDLAERAYHPHEETKAVAPFFRSTLFELSNLEIIEVVNHVMGTCVMFSPSALAAMGDLYQMQDMGNVYGFDDSLASLRLRMLNFQCAFLRGKIGDPVTIEHFDPGEGGTPENGAWTIEKQHMVTEWFQRYTQIAVEFENGQREPFWWDPDVSIPQPS